MLTSTGFDPRHEESSSAAIESLVAHAKSLYSLPTVAAEVLQLTSNPAVDPHALKECILRDPALAAKILRVVNSSLFGLPGEVRDLNQAIALLGIKPLKILVLGFSLPDNLFADVAREQLKWYWTTTLTRAVAAREISEQLFKIPGDEPFLAGLFQSLGVLVLARELGPSYASMLSRATETGVDLRQLEQESLGFDHIALTAALLEQWNMPRQLVEAIASQHDARSLAKDHRLNAPLARILHMANLLSELVGQHHLSVLPDLLEAGETYCSLDRKQLHDLIASLQPKVNHLADVLSLDMGNSLDYTQVLKAAHELMSELAETAFAPSPIAQEGMQTSASLLQEAVQLRAAMDGFLHRTPSGAPVSRPQHEAAPQPAKSTPRRSALKRNGEIWSDQFVDWITLIAGTCRSRRQPVSLVIFDVMDAGSDAETNEYLLAQTLDAACGAELPANTLVETNAVLKRTIVLPAYDRQEAVNFAQAVIRRLEKSLRERQSGGAAIKGIVSAGVAAVTLPSKSFRPVELLTTAERCLAAAQASETSVVKSLEIY